MAKKKKQSKLKPTEGKREKNKRLKAFRDSTAKYTGNRLGQLRNQNTKPRVDPLWTLEDGITYSLLSRFLVCRDRFHIGTIQGWKSKFLNVPLEFGNIFHHMCEAQDRGIATENMHLVAMNYVKHRMAQDPSMSDSTIRDLAYTAELASVTFRHYVEFWERHSSYFLKGVHYFESDFEWIEKEGAFDVPYKLPNGITLRLRGKRDGAFFLKRGKPGKRLFETKTKGNIDEEGITKGLHKDAQTGIYMTALQIESKGTTPLGVLYNVIRRSGSKPRKGEPVKAFGERIEQDILKQPEYYFMRWTREITPDDLAEFQRRTLNPALYQVYQWWQSIKRNPMNPFETACDGCQGECNVSGEECAQCSGTGSQDNLLHFQRPFGQYDSLSNSQRGEFFDIVTADNYFMYEQQKHIFPELSEEDDVDPYLVGIPTE